VYAFEVVPADLIASEAAHVLGAQASVWTEYIPTPARAEYMILPRLLALSEVLWSPKQVRGWDRFVARLPSQFARLDALATEYRVPEPVGLGWDRRVLEDRVHLTIGTPFPGAVIRYTTDGSDPTLSSPRYRGSFDLHPTFSPLTVSARVFLPNGRESPVARGRIVRAIWHSPVAVRPDSLQPGLEYGYLEGKFRSADDVRGLEPLRMGTVPDLELRGDERPEDYGLRLSGLLCVPRDALYSFYLSSDDGSKLRIAGEVVVDRDGQQRDNERPGEIALRAGCHTIEVVFFQATGGAALSLQVSTPGAVKLRVPREWYAHSGLRTP
jgi:hexosaminidase